MYKQRKIDEAMKKIQLESKEKEEPKIKNEEKVKLEEDNQKIDFENKKNIDFKIQLPTKKIE